MPYRLGLAHRSHRVARSRWAAPAAVLAFAAATLSLAPCVARASSLDIDHATPNFRTAFVPPSAAGGAELRDGSMLRLEHPIRRRRPGPQYDGYGYHHPEYYASLGIGAFDPNDQPGSGLYVNGSMGSVFADQVDLGLQLSWYHRSRGGEEFVSEFTDPAGNTVRQVLATQSVSTNLVPLMGAVRVRLPAAPGIEPYVGGAIGWEWLTVDGTDTQGIPFTNDYDGFGAQMLAGVAFSAGPQTALYGEAVYNASTVSNEFDDLTLGQTVREEVNFDGLGFHAGLRFRF
jgi:outer membrane protein with beta-barrel domain